MHTKHRWPKARALFLLARLCLFVVCVSVSVAKWAMDRGSQKTESTNVGESDSFAAPVQRASIELTEIETKTRFKALEHANVHYGGSPLSRIMYFAIQGCLPFANGPVMATLDRLRREFGRDCFVK